MKTDNITDEIANIQDMLGKAYADVHANLLVARSGGANPNMLDRLLELTETAVIRLRNLTETVRLPMQIAHPEAKASPGKWGGRIEVTENGWLHMELDSLLPTCHYKAPRLLVDNLSRLLSGCRDNGMVLPHFKRAMLVIDEHCSIENRQVYDQDNKAWKAIPNALKGVVFDDDDQFSLHLCLISTEAAVPSCHVYVLDQSDTDYFFALHYNSDCL